MKKVFATLQKQQDAYKQQEQQQKQQQLDQQQKQFEQAQESALQEKHYEIENDNLQKQLDRLSKERVAIISATGYGQVESEDANSNGVADVLEASKLALEQQKALHDHDAKIAEVAHKQQELQSKMQMEREKTKVEREKMKNDLHIAKLNVKAKAKTKK